MVLLGGWMFLGDTISMQQLMGMAVAVLGMVLYGVATRCALKWEVAILCIASIYEASLQHRQAAPRQAQP